VWVVEGQEELAGGEEGAVLFVEQAHGIFNLEARSNTLLAWDVAKVRAMAAQMVAQRRTMWMARTGSKHHAIFYHGNRCARVVLLRGQLRKRVRRCWMLVMDGLRDAVRERWRCNAW